MFIEELYKPIINTDYSESKYVVSNYGKIKNILTGNEIKYRIVDITYYHGKKYNVKPRRFATINGALCGNYQQVASYELLAFNPIDNFKNFEVDHINGNPMDDRLENLEWVTSNENKRRASDNNLFPYGENHWNSKYSNELIHDICECIVNGVSKKDIIDRFGVNHQLIDDICSGRSHKKFQKNILNMDLNIQIVKNIGKHYNHWHIKCVN